MNVYESLTAPPYADGDLKKAFEAFDNDIVLSGNVDQIDMLVNSTPSEIRKKTKEIIDIAKPYGNFILSTSDYLSEGTPHENLRAMADAGLEFGSY